MKYKKVYKIFLVFCIILSFLLIYSFTQKKISYGHLNISFKQNSLNKLKKIYKNNTINPELNNFLNIIMKPNGLCSNINNKFIFAYVFTAVNSFEKRQAIRNTWANKSKFSNLKVAFVIAKSRDNIQNKLKEEQLLFNDLIQGDFIDAYRNLSYKSLIAWKYINEYCSNADLVLKIDDDVSVNTFNLIKLFNNKISEFNLTNVKNTFMCRIFHWNSPIRDKYSKWYASFEEYNTNLYGLENVYPKYCEGMYVLMSPDLIENLLIQSYDLKIFWIDDVYVGLVARNLKPNFIELSGYVSDIFSLNEQKLLKNFFFTKCDSIDQYNSIWNQIIK